MKDVDYTTCQLYQQSRITGLPPIMEGIILNKHSKWHKIVNFAVAERMSYVFQRPPDAQSNKCESYLFRQSTVVTPDLQHKQLTLFAIAAVFLVYIIMMVMSFVAFCVEMITSYSGRREKYPT